MLAIVGVVRDIGRPNKEEKVGKMTAVVPFLWAAGVAVAAAFLVGGLLIAFSWALVWGDSPWPQHAMDMIVALSVIIALATGAVCWRAVRMRLRANPQETWGWAAGGAAIFLLVAFWAWHESAFYPG